MSIASLTLFSSSSAADPMSVLKQVVHVVASYFIFEVAATQTWNALPKDVTTPPTLPIFRKRLETHLFRQSYSDIVP